MTALFAAKVVVLAQHLIDHVLVAYRGANHTPTRLGDGSIHACVAHYGGDDGVPCQRTCGNHVEPCNHHDVIAVYHAARFIAQDDPIRVTVVRNTDVRPALAHFRC